MKILAADVHSRAVGILAALALLPVTAVAADAQTSSTFKGDKVNQGTVTHTIRGGQSVLTLSEDFKVPETADAHWRIIDSHGTGYLLQRVVVKPDKTNRMIILPPYIKEVAKVQMWDASAETLLGQASFGSPVAMRHNAASAKAIVAEGVAYDESRMRPRDDATVQGTGYQPVEYDDATMHPKAAKGKAAQGPSIDPVEQDESKMEPK